MFAETIVTCRWISIFWWRISGSLLTEARSQRTAS